MPRTTLQTLVKRGLVEIVEEQADFSVSSMKKRGPSHLDFIFNAEQKAALATIQTSVEEKQFSVSLMHGVTGSGKTAVYLAAMQAVLEQGRAAILLVPEIGLTPAAAANLHQVFGDEVALLHSALSPMSAPSSGIGFDGAMRGWLWVRALRFLRRWRIWR